MTMTMTLAARLVAEAEQAIETATETHYDHTIFVDVDDGIYDVDCSGFVSFLIERVAPRHFAAIADSTDDARPLARDYYRFAAAQDSEPDEGWRGLDRLASVTPGDIIAWELPDRTRGDTGHVFVVAAAAIPSPDDASWALQVHDSTSILHFDDTRGPGKPFATGIGSGVIHLKLDDDGAPVAFRFDPQKAGFETVPIAMMRIEPFSAS